MPSLNLNERGPRNVSILASPRHRSIWRFLITPLLSLVAMTAGVRADEAAPPAPVSLINKWEAGQKWTYNMDMQGKLDIRNPAGNSPLSGMVFEGVDFSINNRLTLDVMEAENGQGLVAFRGEIVKMNATTEMGSVIVDRGQLGVVINGQVIGKTVPVPADTLKNPRQAVRLDALGHCIGVQELPQRATTATADLPVDVNMLVRLFDPRFLPTLWSGKKVAQGDTWQSTFELPLPDANANDKAAGALRWTYKGAGPDPKMKDRTLQQIDVQGEFHVTPEQAALLAAQDENANTPETKHTVSGSVWFDTQIGQVRYARLQVKLHNSTKKTITFNGQEVEDESWMNFAGNVFLSLMDKTPAAAATIQ